MQDILSLNIYQLDDIIKLSGCPPYRSKQVYNWLHKNMVTTFEEMTNIPKSLRTNLQQKFYIPSPTTLKCLVSTDESVKYLFKFSENIILESVLMKSKYGYTICVSTQIGCKMGCTFCASHRNGFVQNLTTGQILSQVYTIQKNLNKKISNIVIMGIGEPLDNYDASVNFIRIISSKDGLNLSQRNITISTCGIVNKMYDLAEEGLNVTLAISIHAGDDIIRKQIMPIANRFTIDEIQQAATNYFNKTRRRVSYEYALIKDINDTKDQAIKLSQRLRHTPSHVNLIPLNPVSESGYLTSEGAKIKAFSKILEDSNISTTIRTNKGQDINAACGQLRLETILN